VSDQTIAEQNLSEVNVLFVHSKLDDFGLTPPEFRIYCHLVRRAKDGVAWPGIRSMAEICRLHKETVILSIASLEAMKLLQVERTPGLVTKYRLTQPSLWTERQVVGNGEQLPLVGNGEQGGRKEGTVEGVTGRNGGTEWSERGNATGRKGGTKGNPFKVIQEGDPSFAREARAVKPGKVRKSRQPEPDQDTDPEVRVFLEGWIDAYEAQFRRPYVPNWGRDGRAIKDLRKAIGLPAADILAVAIKAWCHQGWYCEKAVTVAKFCATWNEINAELTNGTKGTKRYENGKPSYNDNSATLNAGRNAADAYTAKARAGIAAAVPDAGRP
jgi:hypothetical protein